MIDNEVANKETKEAKLKYPTKVRRNKGSSFMLTSDIIANTPKTDTNNPVVFTCQQDERGITNREILTSHRPKGQTC